MSRHRPPVRRRRGSTRRSAPESPRIECDIKEQMPAGASDALVFFGATGDLAYKQIFPALQALVSEGQLDVPIIGVGRSGWTTEQLVARARASLQERGDFDEAAFAKLSRLLHHVDGDYNNPELFQRLRAALG